MKIIGEKEKRRKKYQRQFPHGMALHHTRQVKPRKPHESKNENNVHTRCGGLINLSSSTIVWCIEWLEADAKSNVAF